MNFKGTQQRTLKDSITLKGVGIHSGRPAHLTMKPARPNTGIRFVRTDLDGRPEISAHYKNVINTQMATTIGRGRICVGTVEHVLAALQGLGVDNAILEVDGPEVPIMDGSSGPFAEAITQIGTFAQFQRRAVLALRRKVEVKLGEKWAVAEPSSRMEIHGSIEWDHPAIGYQEFHYIEGKTNFIELARARTFGFLDEVENLKRMGLARGGSLDNAIVLDRVNVLNPDGLRCADELVRHKVLDALGDFRLAGIQIHGYFRLHRAGHDLHAQLLAAIFKDPNNYEIMDQVDATEEDYSPVHAAMARTLAAV
ncbi:UDP-3-O-acyl-N-acetylglucosamine deacetylase [Bdellovibrionota bacterium FG-1]